MIICCQFVLGHDNPILRHHYTVLNHSWELTLGNQLFLMNDGQLTQTHTSETSSKYSLGAPSGSDAKKQEDQSAEPVNRLLPYYFLHWHLTLHSVQSFTVNSAALYHKTTRLTFSEGDGMECHCCFSSCFFSYWRVRKCCKMLRVAFTGSKEIKQVHVSSRWLLFFFVGM